MKIRLGFVSNSSSSAFVVAFPHNPKSAEDVQKILFGERQEYPHPYDSTYYSTLKVATTVWDDIKAKARPASKTEIVGAIKDGYFDGRADYEEFKKGENDYDWEACEKENKKRAIRIAEKFMEENSDAVIYTFNYSDENPYGSALEHGMLFDKLKHLKISYH